MKGYTELCKLLKETQGTGMLDITTPAICDYQDMIAHSNADQLAELARGPLKESFYRVYGYAYGTYEALRFFWENSDFVNALRERIADQEADAELLTTRKEQAEKEAAHNLELAEKMRASWESATMDLKQAQSTIKDQENEIIKLKALLYDMITAK